MAGANFSVDIEADYGHVTHVLNQLIHAGSNLEPALRDIGEHFIISHKQRFEEQKSPEGESWDPLSPKYKARKKKNTDKILVLDGFLKDLLHYDVSGSELLFGTDRIYGATHQFGDPDRNIPARPFIGVSRADEVEIRAILTDYLDSDLG